VEEVSLPLTHYWQCHFARELASDLEDGLLTERKSTEGGSKGGQRIFFLGKRKRFLLKTLSAEESAKFLSMEPSLHEHMRSSGGHSLLPKVVLFLAVIHPPSSSRIHLMAFSNVQFSRPVDFLPLTSISYDLKPSRKRAQCWTNLSTSNFGNFLFRYNSHFLSYTDHPQSPNWFWTMYYRDIQLIEEVHNVSDFSLLIVIDEYVTSSPGRCPSFHDEISSKQVLLAPSAPLLAYPSIPFLLGPHDSFHFQVRGSLRHQRNLTTIQLHPLFSSPSSSPPSLPERVDSGQPIGHRCICSYLGIIDVFTTFSILYDRLGHVGQPKYSDHGHLLGCLVASRFIPIPSNSKDRPVKQCPADSEWDCDPFLIAPPPPPHRPHKPSSTG
jgi:hypothetical protein